MCTLPNLKLTEVKRKKLKKTGNVAWKIVLEKNGKYFSSMANNSFQYSKTGRNTPNYSESYLGYDERYRPDNLVRDGVFHLFSTRQVTREVKAIMGKIPMWVNRSFKIIKVIFNKADFFVAGENVNFHKDYDGIWEKHPNKAICVKAFTFVE